MKVSTKLSPDYFLGQGISVGIDVHKKNWSVTLVLKGYCFKNFLL